MCCPLSRPTVAVCVLLAFNPGADASQQDLSVHDLGDPMLRSELLELGGYQELVQEFRPGTLVPVTLVKATGSELEFRDGATRVHIENLPFTPVVPPRRNARGWTLEGRPLTGWTPGATHTRLARLELVHNGAVGGPAYAMWRDICDAPLLLQGVPYAAVMRSRDGVRTYVHLQAGEGPDGRMVTWVFTHGVFLCRVVDEAPLW